MDEKELLEVIEKKVEDENKSENVVEHAQLSISDNFETVTPKDIWNQYEHSRFCRPADLDIKDVTRIENTIVDAIPTYFNHIRVSELVPHGIYNYLSGMSYKRSIQTSRSMELCSDLSVSLALEGLLKRKKGEQGPIFMSGFDTTLRAQNFYGANGEAIADKENYKFGVPHAHFTIYGNSIVGKEGKEFYFTKKNLPKLINHYLTIIKQLEQQGYTFNDVEIELSDMRHTEEILQKYGHTLHEYRDYQLRERTETGREPNTASFLPDPFIEQHESIESLSKTNDFNEFGLNIGYLKTIGNELEKVTEKFPARLSYKLGRSRGAGQYSTLAFSIFATNKDGKRIDIADGGITNRGEKLLGTDKERCIVGGMGTNLIASLFKK